MKKKYTRPLAVAVNLESSGLMAMSLAIDNDKVVDTSEGGVQLGREYDSNTGGSVWEQGW